MATKVKERPILFNAEEVRAILDGQKVQKRDVIKPQPQSDRVGYGCIGGQGFGFIFGPGDLRKCPYGHIGDRLWVQETFYSDMSGGRHDDLYYKADLGVVPPPRGDDYGYSWRPPSLMPRWASRINLLVKDVRVERVQTISKEDAIAEGIHGHWDGIGGPNAVTVFKQLWDSINAKRGFGWDVNPWVWVVEFERIESEKSK